MTLIDESKTAQTSTPILPVLAGRWSPRSYTGAPIDETKISAFLEAARWSPSAGNSQPWRFIVARRGSEAFDTIAKNFVSFNAVWAPAASVLIVAIYRTTDDEGTPRPNGLYDLGQAMAHLSVQAHHDGLYVHQTLGFDRDAIAAAFELPEGYEIFTISAVGEAGEPELLDDGLAERERLPRTRLALDEILLVNE